MIIEDAKTLLAGPTSATRGLCASWMRPKAYLLHGIERMRKNLSAHLHMANGAQKVDFGRREVQHRTRVPFGCRPQVDREQRQ